MTTTRTIDTALIGLGNVGRNLLRILEMKRARLADDYGLAFRVVCAADSSGCAVDPAGFDVAELRRHKEQGGRVARPAGFRPRPHAGGGPGRAAVRDRVRVLPGEPDRRRARPRRGAGGPAPRHHSGAGQ